MPVLASRKFSENPHVVNIELGAGCGNFGQNYHSECFLTDSLSIHELEDRCNNCYIHVTCDAHAIPCRPDRFSFVIMCNPYGYGFSTSESSRRLLDEVYRISRIGSQTLILTTGNSRYSAPKRVEKRINEYNDLFDDDRFEFVSSPINVDTLYPGYVFYDVAGKKQITPKFKIELICLK